MKEPISNTKKTGLFKKKSWVILSVLALCFGAIMYLIPGNSNGIENDPTDNRITIVDSSGREVTLEGPAERVAYSHHSLTDSFKLIGAWDQIVGRDANVHDENLFPGLHEIPAICPSMNPMDLNYEKIIELHPDVLILPKFDWYVGEDEIIQKLEPEIPVVFLDLLDPDPSVFCNSMHKLGLIAGNDERAEEYIEFYNDIYDQITEKTSHIAPDDRPNVFFKAIGKVSPNQIITYGSDMPWTRSFFTAAGARNVAEELPITYAEVDNEWLINQDIDVIVVKCREDSHPDIFGYSVPDRETAFRGAEEIRNDVMKTDVFAHTDAVQEGNVYLFHDSMEATQHNIIGIAYLAKWLHPDEFDDLDPEAIHQEYLSRFMDSDYDLSKGGLFAYPY